MQEKTDGDKIEEVVDGEEEWIGLAEEMFGIPASAFEGYAVVQMNQKTVSILPKFFLGEDRKTYVSVGLTLFHTRMKIPKMSTAAALAFGCHATKMIVELNEKETDLYFQRKKIELRPESLKFCTRDGYVIVMHALKERVLPIGVGRLRSVGEKKELESYYPKAFIPKEEIFSASRKLTNEDRNE